MGEEPGDSKRRGSVPLHRNVPFIAGMAVLLQTLDSTAIAIVLPEIAREMQVDIVAVSATVTSYLLGAAALAPANGWLADRYGTRNVFRASILLFTLASLGCALASSLSMLTAFRIIEGGASALLVPLGRLLVIQDAPRERRTAALATFVTPALLGPMIGPVIGALCLQYADWRWVFLLNLPLGLASILIVTLRLDNRRAERCRPLDVMGLALSCAALAALVSGLNRVSDDPGMAIPLMAVGCGLGLAMVVHARRAPTPLLQFGLLRNQGFRCALGVDLTVRLLLMVVPVLISLMLQVGLGLSPMTSGVLLLCVALGAFASKPIIAALVSRWGNGRVAVGSVMGMSFTLIACGVLAPKVVLPAIGALLVLHGFFRTLVLNAVTVSMFDAVNASDYGAASSFASSGQQLSQVLGVSLALLFLQYSGGDDLDVAEISRVVVLAGVCVLPAALVATRMRGGPTPPGLP